MSNIVFIGNIPNSWNLENLKSVVCGCGRIVEVRCLMDQPDKNKGYGFVEFASPEDAARALPLLQAIRIANSSKRPRVELSKVGARTDGSLSKPILDLNRNYLPPNVILPDEMLRLDAGMPMGQPQQRQHQHGNVLDQLPPEFIQLMTTNQQFQQIVTQMVNSGIDIQKIIEVTKPYFDTARATPQPQQAYNAPASAQVPGQNALPDFLKNASTYLPQPPANALKAEDTIDSSLKKFDPPLLIQLITNLKEVVDTSNSYNAVQVIKDAPDLAVSSAQALLLMGFIDADVIQEAMVQSQSQQQSAAPTPQPPAPPAPVVPQQQIDPLWQGLANHTVEKLSKLDRAQANMIAQVLKMTQLQVSQLPPDQSAMVQQLRNEYL